MKYITNFVELVVPFFFFSFFPYCCKLKMKIMHVITTLLYTDMSHEIFFYFQYINK